MPQKINSAISTDSLKRIIQEGNAQELVIKAEELGNIFGKKKKRGNDAVVSTSQIRAIFGTVRQIEMNWPPPEVTADADKAQKAQRDLTLLKPKVVYRAARENTPEFYQFADMMNQGIDLVLADGQQTRQRFGHFVDFLEAILAYHKVASESKNKRGR